MTTLLRSRLNLEPLDRRDLPSITLSGGVLTIAGDDRNDTGSVSLLGGGTLHVSQSSFAPGASFGFYQSMTVQASGVTKIVFEGEGGNDKFTNGTGITSVASGGAGFDTLRGGSGRDYIYGGGLNDHLYGGSGNDYLSGGVGIDTIDGDAGDDLLEGGSENDILNGGLGEDSVYGGSGNDRLDGGGYDYREDLLVGGADADTFYPVHHVWFDPYQYIGDIVWDFDESEGDEIQ